MKIKGLGKILGLGLFAVLTFFDWAKDAAGNVSASVSKTTTVTAIAHQWTSGDHLNYAGGAGVMAWDHVVLPDDNRILVVTTALNSNSGATVTGVAFNGSSLTRKAASNPFFAEEVTLWYMLEPPVGTYRVEVNYSRTHYGLEARASTYAGVNQYRPFSNVITQGANGPGPATVTVGSDIGELVIDGLAHRNGGVIVADPAQTERYNQRDEYNSHGASEKAGALPSVTMSWTLQGSDIWAIVAASLKPAATPAVRTVRVKPSCTGENACYTSLNDAIVHEAAHGSLVDGDILLEIELYSMADVAKVDLRPFDGLTDANHYIRIFTPRAERHQGVWDDTKYHLDIAATISPGYVYPDCILVGSAEVWFDGIQLNCSSACSNYPSLVAVDPGTAATTLKVSNSILRGSFTGVPTGDTNGFHLTSWNEASEAHLWNNIIYDLTCSGGAAGRVIHGLVSGSGNWYVYNTTLYNSVKGLSVSGVQVHVRNSIANGIGLSAWSGCASDSDYNITNLDESITGAHSKRNTTVMFVDAAARDLRLSPDDTAAVDAGQNLLNSPSVNGGEDITGQLRDALWDIGAFEAAVMATIYVSKDGYCIGHIPCFPNIQDGIDSASAPSLIKMTQETYNENIILDFDQVITFQGGWDTNFTSCSSYTTILGSITITNGTMILENIIVK